jgi:hypothetical protein
VRTFAISLAIIVCLTSSAFAEVGDPQLRTDHPWYPGELAISSFERLAKTQAEVYERVTGRRVKTDEDKALAAWLWRNTHFAHGECGAPDAFDRGFRNGDWVRDYWLGLFGHGMALCGTTHAQWTAEMESLLGHGKARAVGVTGHNSFEVFLTGGAYGDGRWVLLDHDVSTVIFNESGSRLIGIDELKRNLSKLGNPAFKPGRQRGWRVSGLHDADVRGSFDSYRVAEYFAGFAGAPPMTHLRSGETLRRYHQPGLDDGKTFVYWGRNYKSGKIDGPERSRTWVNQPEQMFRSKNGTGWRQGQVRFANAVYTFRPSFADGSYRQAVISETAEQFTLEFRTPYVIAATPPNDKPWGIYDDGCTNGLTISGQIACKVNVSTDRGRTWHEAKLPASRTSPLDLTDHVKGHQQYWLRFDVNATQFVNKDVTIRTICQANPSVLPRLKDGGTKITFQASGLAMVSAGPNLDQAMQHRVAGSLKRGDITLELKTPRGESAVAIHANSWNASGNPPDPNVNFQIEFSIDNGKSWNSVVKNWNIPRRKPEPPDFWSQSFTYGHAEFDATANKFLVRFRNSGRRSYRRVEAHLVYETQTPSSVMATFCWTENNGVEKTAGHSFTADSRDEQQWQIDTGKNALTKWVELIAR